MSSESTWVSWIIQCDVKVSNRDQLLVLAEEMASNFLKNESGTVNFEWSVNSDFSQLHLHERYEESTTAIAHIQKFGDIYAQKFLALASIKSVTVYGNPSNKLLETLSGMSPNIFTPFAGFTR